MRGIDALNPENLPHVISTLVIGDFLTADHWDAESIKEFMKDKLIAEDSKGAYKSATYLVGGKRYILIYRK